MIQITAYLRTEEDLERWKAIENKAEFMHQALGKQSKVIKTPEDAKQVLAEKSGAGAKTEALKFCPNGHPIPEGKTKCMGKGCKYS